MVFRSFRFVIAATSCLGIFQVGLLLAADAGPAKPNVLLVLTDDMGKWHLTSNVDGNYRGLQPVAAEHYGFDFAPPLLPDDEFEPGGDRGVGTLTDQAIEFIAANRERPWFCYLSHHMIHGIVVAPDELTEKYREQGFTDEGPNRAVYLAGLECIDHSVGRLMTALQELGEAENTIVIFLSGLFRDFSGNCPERRFWRHCCDVRSEDASERGQARESPPPANTDGGREAPSAHRRPGYSSTGCSSAEPASASPSIDQHTSFNIRTSQRSLKKPRRRQPASH